MEKNIYIEESLIKELRTDEILTKDIQAMHGHEVSDDYLVWHVVRKYLQISKILQ